MNAQTTLQTDSEILSLLNRGIALYEQLVGVSREKTSGKFTLGQYEDRRILEAMDEALTSSPA